MNSKLMLTVFVAVFAAGACLYFFVRWHQSSEEDTVASGDLPKRQIGFAAILAESDKS